MEYRWIDDMDEFRGISGPWDKALAGSGSRNPFLLSGFITTWWKYYHEGRKPMIFVAHDGEAIAGGIPLCVNRGKGAYGFTRTLSHMGGPLANYTEPFYASPGIRLFPVLREAMAERGGYEALYLPDIRAENVFLKEVEAPPADKAFRVRLMQDHDNWAIDLSGGVDGYMAGISGKLKRDLRSKRRSLARDHGSVRLEKIAGKEEVEKYFDLYARFSRDAFSARRRNSNFEDERYKGFFREFLVIMDREKRLDAHALLAGDKVMAISFGYNFGRGFDWVLTGFNNEYKYFRPGYLLIEDLVKEVSGRGETYYNWYGHERFYKTQWCNSRSPLYRFVMIRKTCRGTLYGALFAAEKALRSSRLAVNIARKFRGS